MRMAEGIRKEKSVSPDFDVAGSNATSCLTRFRRVGHRDPPASYRDRARPVRLRTVDAFLRPL